MSIWLWFVFLYLIMQRFAELLIASRNEKWMRSKGAFEVGEDHYKWFVITHSLFFVSILTEALLSPTRLTNLFPLLFSLFLLTQLFRFWCIASLGYFWNTKIIILPGSQLVNQGPYRFMKHPNYFIVGVELLIIPLLFGSFITAIVFPIIHLVLLRVRIPQEEKALLHLSTEKL